LYIEFNFESLSHEKWTHLLYILITHFFIRVEDKSSLLFDYVV